jgi:hypothetical protein
MASTENQLLYIHRTDLHGSGSCCMMPEEDRCLKQTRRSFAASPPFTHDRNHTFQSHMTAHQLHVALKETHKEENPYIRRTKFVVREEKTLSLLQHLVLCLAGSKRPASPVIDDDGALASLLINRKLLWFSLLIYSN